MLDHFIGPVIFTCPVHPIPSKAIERTEELARPAGFEPTTPWFVARYSIQLSYSRPDN